MIGDVPCKAEWSMEQLANTIDENENLSRARLIKLTTLPEPKSNLATYVRRDHGAPQPGHVQIVGRGAVAPAASVLLFATNIFVSGVETDVDVYRLQR